MRDKSGAHHVAPDGSRLAILPTTSGGTATLPRAPGQDRPRTASSGAARPDRPRATPRAPDQDVPQALVARVPGSDRPSAAPRVPVSDRLRPVQKAPGQDRPRTASSDVVRPGRPRATPRAPGADVPPATSAGAPGQHRLRAAQRAHDHCRSRPASKAPGQDRPRTASSDAARPDRLRATLRAPDQDVPQALVARVPGSDRPCAVAAAAAVPDGPRVSHPVAGPDSSHRGPAAGPRLTSLTTSTMPAHDMYSRTYTAEESKQHTPAAPTPVLTATVRLLLALIQRAQGLDIGPTLDVLRHLLQDRPALTPVSDSALLQSLGEAVAYADTPPQPPEQGAPPSDRPPFKPP